MSDVALTEGSLNGVKPQAVHMFRSRPMDYVQIMVQQEFAIRVLELIGEANNMHIIDLSPKDAPTADHLAHKRLYVEAQIWEKKLEALEKLITSKKIKVPESDDYKLPPATDGALVEVKAVFDPIDSLLANNSNYLDRNLQELTAIYERHQVIKNWHQLREAQGGRDPLGSAEGRLVPLDDVKQVDGVVGYYAARSDDANFHSFTSGVMPASAQGLFNRMLYRVSRGNSLVSFTEFEYADWDRIVGDAVSLPELKEQKKVIFHVTTIGARLVDKVQRLCTLVGAQIYHMDADSNPAREEAAILDAINARVGTERETLTLLSRLVHDVEDLTYGNPSKLRTFQAIVRRERNIREALMKAAYYTSQIRLEGWVPSDEAEALKSHVLGSAQRHSMAGVLFEINPSGVPHSAPPTLFTTNKFFSVFQGIVDTYGVPRYREVNPALFTIITFPFLFGVMYGDIGHGIFLTLAALLMVWKEKKFEQSVKNKTAGEIFSMAFGGRYILLLMGMFAVYCGFIYNDCMSIPLRLSASAWEEPMLPANVTSTTNLPANATLYTKVSDSQYLFGIDPNWYHTNNQLTFFNSFKMKSAVTLGVTQMTLGLFLSLANHVHFGDKISIFFEFIPRLLFLWCTFGYMIFLIIFKWCVDWTNSTVSPPNLVQTMISMFLSPGSVSSDKLMYSGQGAVQAALLLIAFVSVPVMLVVPPLLKHKCKPQQQHHGSDTVVENEESKLSLSVDEPLESKHAASKPQAAAAAGHGHEQHSLGEDMIHQAIHTIEYVLGTVSNTASYLRLWALSLAHERLAWVFWNKLIYQYGIHTKSFIGVFIGWGAWFGATFSVLLCMDVLECFLHALRLHWVEFQNKFFSADGYQFVPFSTTA